MITVRYIGPEAAILAGTYILHGETRVVSAAQLAEAQLHHPDGFVIEDGVCMAAPIATADDQASAPFEQVAADLLAQAANDSAADVETLASGLAQTATAPSSAPPPPPPAPVRVQPQPRPAKRRR